MHATTSTVYHLICVSHHRAIYFRTLLIPVAFIVSSLSMGFRFLCVLCTSTHCFVGVHSASKYITVALVRIKEVSLYVTHQHDTLLNKVIIQT